uniref:Uncharacterized protein n=1 Tax=Nonomuraea gerenzanensis TaxID=93944 RepID=A0A1M4EKA0_9ACTN|nr:hypothetical protein BN4615_P8796 [Nonomuraea gerenzanensis]
MMTQGSERGGCGRQNGSLPWGCTGGTNAPFQRADSGLAGM